MIITTETQVFHLNRIIIIATVKGLFGLFRESHFSNRNLFYGIKKVRKDFETFYCQCNMLF